MEHMIIAALAGAVLWQAGEAATVVCEAPTPPAVIRPIKPARPAVPPCVDEARSRHNCRPAVISAYNRQMETYSAAFDAYATQLGAYVDALNQYISAVNVYASCERKAVGVDGVIIG